MAKAKTLIKGNYAIAEAAVRAGCTFFSGYPITPQSEVLEYMSWRLPEIGGQFVQTESEIAGISMVYGAASCGVRAMTSSSGPGFDLMQEGISYLASGEVPCVIVDLMRYASGLGNITPSQGDYLQLAKNGGHGDYRCVVLAPADVQETVDFMMEAFDIAEKYCNPVLVACDGSIGQMVEAVEFPDEIKKHDQNQYDWAIKLHREGRYKKIGPRFHGKITAEEYDVYTLNKIKNMQEHEARWEEFYADDADVVIVAYGTPSRICKEAVLKARKEGFRLGIIRLQTLWPFPAAAFQKSRAKAFLAVEMCSMPQMVYDVALAARGVAPTYSYITGVNYPTIDNIIAEAKKALSGEALEV